MENVKWKNLTQSENSLLWYCKKNITENSILYNTVTILLSESKNENKCFNVFPEWNKIITHMYWYYKKSNNHNNLINGHSKKPI